MFSVSCRIVDVEPRSPRRVLLGLMSENPAETSFLKPHQDYVWSRLWKLPDSGCDDVVQRMGNAHEPSPAAILVQNHAYEKDLECMYQVTGTVFST